MFYLLFVLIFATFMTLFIALRKWEIGKGKTYKSDEVSPYTVLGWITGIIASVIFIIGVAENLGSYTAQIERFETVRKNQCNINIYDSRYDFLIDGFRKSLAETYPELEKEIFKDMIQPNKNQLLALFIAYPQLQSSRTLTAYVNKMQELADAKYKEMLAAQGVAAKIRFKYASPWQIIKPSIPEDIKPLVYMCKY